MKKSTLLFLAFTSIALSATATVHAVNNNLNGPGQFSNLQTAITNASSGDTIYIASSPTNYTDGDGVFQMSKKLTIIGVGMRPGEKKENSALSRIGCRFDINDVAANGSSFIGLYFPGISSALNVTGNVSNCQVLRCWFESTSNYLVFTSGSFSGWLIANNYFSISCGPGINMNNNTCTNFLFQNNVFVEASGCGVQTNAIAIYAFPNSANCIVSNNLFYGGQGSGVANNDQAFSNVDNFIIENNIFHTMSPAGASNSVFNNNITFGTASNSLPYGNNSGANNVSDTDPQLTTFSNATFNPNQNFQPAAGPAKTGGVGGAQMGVYGGTLNWNNSAVPPIPVIKNFSITSGATVPAGGSMTIKVTSTRQN
jgi:hypothetical protein